MEQDRLNVPPDYDQPLEKPGAKELAASLRGANLVMVMTAIPEPQVEIFRDQLAPFVGKKDPCLVCVLTRANKYRYYSIPFAKLLPLLGWVRLTDEKRPRWRLHLVPSKHQLVARNGPRVEIVDLQPYYNRH